MQELTAPWTGFGAHQEIIAPTVKLTPLSLLDESQTGGEVLVPDTAKEIKDTSFGRLTGKTYLPPEI